MSAQKLSTIRVEKPWGRHELWPGFTNPLESGTPVGEIWFDAPGETDPELLVKYLFTSERLSIQVHPNDTEARAAGYPRGKDEAWVVLAAAPNSKIALGTVRPVSREELRAAALDGSIEALMDWKAVKAGDVFYSPAGTVHAIGAGITLIEVQQNIDLTYRIYDYGRPRELHLDAGVTVSDPVPFIVRDESVDLGNGRTILAQGGKFVLERWSWSGERTLNLTENTPFWFIPVAGHGSLDDEAWAAGECWMMRNASKIALEPNSDVLFAYPSAYPIDIM
jgi:mannose-6-phosphate isomerase